MRGRPYLVLLIPLFLIVHTARAGEGGTLRLELPADTKLKSAVAVASGLKLEAAGKVDGTMIVFEKLLPETPYDVRLTLADDTIIQGVDLSWYNEEEPKPDAGELRDNDKKEMMGILNIPDFYNKKDILIFQGTHERATTLVQLVRDKDFYAGTGQVIWRIELYYFKNQHGGWEKLSQQNKIIRRERFKTQDAYKFTTGKLRFAGELGGLKLDKNQTERTVKVNGLPPAK
jgi:hypothetical protein